MASNPVIYLAGPIQHADDGGHGWREAVRETHPAAESGVRWSDPLDKYDGHADAVVIHNGNPPEDAPRDADLISVTELVEADKDLVDGADGVLVGWDDVPSAGTPMETLLAHQQDKPIAVWYRGEVGISPWMQYHAGLVSEDVSECVEWLSRQTQEVVEA